MVITAVVSGNYIEFVEWCKDLGISIKNPLIRYVDKGPVGILKLRGYYNLNVAYIGTYYKRDDISDIVKFVATRQR